MPIKNIRPKSVRGFTMIEMIVVVAIIGILSAIAIPMLISHQLRAKSTEAKTNLSAIRVVEEANFSETGLYLPAAAEPRLIPGSTPAVFDAVGSDYATLGWAPEGRVYFSYAVAVSDDQSGYTADAAADIDANGLIQLWGYSKPTGMDDLVAGGLGCDPTRLSPEVIGSCNLAGSIF